MAEETPQAVALQLTRIIAFAEGKNINITGGGNAGAPTREWILKTYAQCLKTMDTPSGVDDHLKIQVK